MYINGVVQAVADFEKTALFGFGKSPTRKFWEALKNVYEKIPYRQVTLPAAAALGGGGLGYALGDEEGALLGALGGAGAVAGYQQLPKLLQNLERAKALKRFAKKHPQLAGAIGAAGLGGAGLGAGYGISELAGLNEEPWYAF